MSKKIFAFVLTTAMLAGCGPNLDQAKKLGFSSVAELEEAKKLGIEDGNAYKAYLEKQEEVKQRALLTNTLKEDTQKWLTQFHEYVNKAQTASPLDAPVVFDSYKNFVNIQLDRKIHNFYAEIDSIQAEDYSGAAMISFKKYDLNAGKTLTRYSAKESKGSVEILNHTQRIVLRDDKYGNKTLMDRGGFIFERVKNLKPGTPVIISGYLRQFGYQHLDDGIPDIYFLKNGNIKLPLYLTNLEAVDSYVDNLIIKQKQKQHNKTDLDKNAASEQNNNEQQQKVEDKRENNRETNAPLNQAMASASAPVALSSETFTPSFDCSKASNGQERMVCSDRDLAKLDVQLAQIYAKAREKASDKESLKKEQLNWIKFSLRACSDKTCLTEAYKRRISELQ